MARQCFNFPSIPDDDERWSRIRAALLGARASARSRVVTTRSSPPGTALRSPHSPRPACCSIAPISSKRRLTARLLIDVHLVDGRLRRVSRDGVVGQPAGVLEDYADVAEGLLALAQVTVVARVARSGWRAARRLPCAFRRRSGWVFRHRRRCRGVGAAAAESDGRRDTGGTVGGSRRRCLPTRR